MKYTLPEQADRARARIAQLQGEGKKVAVEVKEYKPTRSNQQNNYLWGCVYPTVLEAMDSLEGWTAKDLHEYFLGEHFGWERLEGMGKTRMRPMRRSSSLNKQEFVDYVEFIQRTMAERGVYIPDPNEEAA